MLRSWFRDHGTIPTRPRCQGHAYAMRFRPLQESSKASKWRIRHPNDIRVLMFLTAAPRIADRTVQQRNGLAGQGRAADPPKGPSNRLALQILTVLRRRPGPVCCDRSPPIWDGMVMVAPVSFAAAHSPPRPGRWDFSSTRGFPLGIGAVSLEAFAARVASLEGRSGVGHGSDSGQNLRSGTLYSGKGEIPAGAAPWSSGYQVIVMNQG